MKKKIILSVLFTFIISCLFISNVQAAGSFSVSAKSTSIKKGKTTTVTIKANSCAGKFTIASSDTSVATVSTSSMWVENGSSSFTVTAKKNGTAKITVTASNVSDTSENDVSGSKSVTIKVSDSGSSKDNTTAEDASDATLSNLGITPNDFTGFKKATTTYNVTVPKSTEKISIYANATNSKATVAGTGTKTLKTGKNTFNVKVTAQDKKTTKTYTLNITRKSEDDVSNDATLSNFGITPKEYDFTGFTKTKTGYTAEVPNDVSEIYIYGNTSNDKATVTGTGTKKVDVGKNEFEIKVTAEDKKTTKVYNLTVTRKGEDEEEDDEDESTTNTAGVTTIKVGNYTLTPEFDPKVYEYKVNLPTGVQNLDVDVTAEDGIEIEVVGNEKLAEGENVITVLANDTKKDDTTIYQIVANVGGEVANTKDEQEEQGLKKHDWFVIIIGVIVIAIILVLLFLIRMFKSREYEEEGYDDDEEYDYDYDEKYEEKSYTKKQIDEEDEEDLYSINDIYEDEDEGYRRRGKYKGRRFKE